MKPIEKTIYDYFLDYATASPEKPFLFDEARRLSVRGALWTFTDIANRLHDLGIRQGTRVALRCTRSIDTCLIYLALEMMGATVLMTDPHQNVEAFLKDAGAEAEFCITNEKALGGIAANGNWEVLGLGGLPIPEPRQEVLPRFSTEIDLYAPATVIFTSGSTGRSKGVMLSQYNLVNHIRNFSVSGCYLSCDVSAELLPVHHVFGLAVLLMSIFMRYCNLVPQSTQVEYVAQCIEKYKITRLDGVPSFALALAERHRAVPFCADSLRVGVLGGAPSTKAQFDFIEAELGIKLLPVYGQSECIGITGANETQNDIVRSSTVGGFLPMNEGCILDDSGNVLPRGQVGEVCVKGPAVMLGYLDDEDGTRAAIDALGRLHTGDLGYLDENGNLRLSGRKKDIIIRNGNNISARKLEDALLALEAVANAAVVGVSHEKLGEVPCALVVPKAGCDLSEAEVRAALAEALARIELPEKIRFCDAIPLTSSGKTDKQRIKAMF